MKAARRVGLLCVLVLPFAAVGESRQDPADDDERAEQIALGRIVFDNSCRMCHEPELVNQQRLTPAQWDATIEKMIGWGATVAPEEVASLRAYLNASFGPANAHKAPAWGMPLLKEPPKHVENNSLVDSSTARRGAATFVTHCQNCHGSDARGGEPGQNLVEQEILTDPAGFAEILRTGRHKMPSYAEVLDATAIEEIRAWLLTLRYEPNPR